MSLVHLATTRYSVTHDFREAIQRHATELVTNELGRCDDEWRSALLSLRETVAALERAYDAIVNKGQTMPSGAASLHVEGMLETAAEEVDRAAEHAKGETRLQLGHAQALAERLETELGVARDELTQTRARLDAERTARTRVESESVDARARYEQTLAEREAELRRHATDLDAQRQECATLSQQLAAVRAGNQNMVGVLQTIHGQIRRAMTSVLQAGPDTPGEGSSTPGWPDTAGTGGVASEGSPGRSASAAVPTPAEAAARATVPPPAAPVTEAPEATLVSYAATLLEAAETSYRQDLESGLLPLDVVERLTSNLRRAHGLFAQHAGHLQNGHATLFETTVMRLADTRGGTAFGRHLGIAAYELFSPSTS
jgi:hypothetical protein